MDLRCLAGLACVASHNFTVAFALNTLHAYFALCMPCSLTMLINSACCLQHHESNADLQYFKTKTFCSHRNTLASLQKRTVFSCHYVESKYPVSISSHYIKSKCLIFKIKLRCWLQFQKQRPRVFRLGTWKVFLTVSEMALNVTNMGVKGVLSIDDHKIKMWIRLRNCWRCLVSSRKNTQLRFNFSCENKYIPFISVQNCFPL